MTALLAAALTFTLAHHTPDTLVEYRSARDALKAAVEREEKR